MKAAEMLKAYKQKVEDALEKEISVEGLPEQAVFDAAKYSIMLGGKRVRPAIMLEFCRLCGGNADKAIHFAMAMEMIHTSSLIHDDLPCMDNDDMRRGKPSCHKAFSEDIALLAGDALLLWPFAVAAKTDLPAERVCKAVQCLAHAAGPYGMVGGQVCDLAAEKDGAKVDADYLRYTQKRKTGALICASAEIGCILADATAEQTAAAVRFSDNIGLVFQIVDDILDVTGDEATLGKPIGSDAANNKPTWVTLLGVEKAEEYAAQLTREAKSALDIFGDEANAMKEFADMLLNRRF